MSTAYYHDHELMIEDLPVRQIAEQYGTPCYIYSRATLENNWRAFYTPLQDRPHLICYAVKANSNLAILNLLQRMGSGFDIVSGGELQRVLTAGGDPRRVVFSGVGKREDEIVCALEAGIGCFNLESPAEMHRVNAIAGRMGLSAPVSLRVNPDVDAKTHPYISTGLKDNKFGIHYEEAFNLYREAAALPHLDVIGIDCHIGSQLTSLEPYRDALQRIIELCDALDAAGMPLQHLDVGGGLGIRYIDETPPTPAEYLDVLLEALGDRPLKLMLEPGRAVIGNAGILVSRVEYLKHNPGKSFAIVDAAMNDLMRPALYQARQDIMPVQLREDRIPRLYDVVGPVCETADFLGKSRMLPVAAGDLLAVTGSGAYGFAMASNYNSRARSPEIMVDGATAHLIRPRETIESLFAGERLLT